MCSSTMTNLRSLHPIASSAAILLRHKLCFNVPGSAWIEPSWASVEPIEEEKNDINANVNTNTNTHGVLYKLTGEDFLREFLFVNSFFTKYVHVTALEKYYLQHVICDNIATATTLSRHCAICY